MREGEVFKKVFMPSLFVLRRWPAFPNFFRFLSLLKFLSEVEVGVEGEIDFVVFVLPTS